MPHYYSEHQEGTLNLRKFQIIIRGMSFEFFTGSGVFSKNKLDKGTQLLIENMIINENDTVLDFGTGVGIIGIVASKCFPKAKVIMTELNKRAVKLARLNIELNHTANAEIRQGNLFESIREKFNAILVNPPMKAGYDTCFNIIAQSKDFLIKGGTLQLVAMHNKGGKRLSVQMKEVFGNTEEIAKKSGYRVYVSKNQIKETCLI